MILGIDKIANILLPFREDVRYIVSHQFQEEKFLRIPKELLREDVVVSQIPGKGLTKSRNNAIRTATGDICVIADDDVRYTNDYFDTIIDVYEVNAVDVACFKIKTTDGQPEYKKYPDRIVDVTSLQSYSPSSIEITFRLKPVIERGLCFDERFGLGSWLNGGGENLFVYDAINSGLKVKFFPVYIVQHPFESTIRAFSKYADRRIIVGGAIDARLNGKIAIIKAFAGMLKFLPNLLRCRKNPITYLSKRLSGVVYILNSQKQETRHQTFRKWN